MDKPVMWLAGLPVATDTGTDTGTDHQSNLSAHCSHRADSAIGEMSATGEMGGGR